MPVILLAVRGPKEVLISAATTSDTRTGLRVKFLAQGFMVKCAMPIKLSQVIVLDPFPTGLTDTRADPDILARWAPLQDLAPINRGTRHLSVELLIGQDAPLALEPFVPDTADSYRSGTSVLGISSWWLHLCVLVE